jgi:hypothetical protein
LTVAKSVSYSDRVERSFKTLADSLTHYDLKEIAHADYGQEAAEHFDQLVRIKDFSSIPVPMDWNPKEVLSLYGWSEPSPALSFVRTNAFHNRRAFCCIALLVASTDPDGPFTDRSHVIQLIESLDMTAISRDHLELFGWLADQKAAENVQDAVFILLGQLYLSSAVPGIKDGELATILDKIMLLESAIASTDLEDGFVSVWLGRGRLENKWRELGSKLTERAISKRLPILEAVHLIAATILA